MACVVYIPAESHSIVIRVCDWKWLTNYLVMAGADDDASPAVRQTMAECVYACNTESLMVLFTPAIGFAAYCRKV